MYPVVLSGSQRAPQIGHGDRIVGPQCVSRCTTLPDRSILTRFEPHSYIPEGTQARMHFFSMQRDPNNFSYPNTWFPDRWLIAEGLQDSPEKLVHNVNAFVPFSFGPSNCVGKNLALQELRMVIANIVQKVDLRFAEGWDPAQYERDIKDHFVIIVPPLMVSARRRD